MRKKIIRLLQTLVLSQPLVNNSGKDCVRVKLNGIIKVYLVERNVLRWINDVAVVHMFILM